mmetsp:Transcript_98494/g.249993  ORF Transcript_98494/g.249993 Transcript_98494/m.249993 type:complete len:105 (-) Transcript_98494:326-640(-)
MAFFCARAEEEDEEDEDRDPEPDEADEEEELEEEEDECGDILCSLTAARNCPPLSHAFTSSMDICSPSLLVVAPPARFQMEDAIRLQRSKQRASVREAASAKAA